MNAGQLRHRVAIQTKTETRSARGGVVESWATAATRWGSIEPLRMREVFEAQQVDARLSHRVILRHYAGLTTQHRLTHAGRTFHIHAVRNLDERDVLTEVLCMEQS
jgi:SPP1 family predicted phage head-tail adaptor